MLQQLLVVYKVSPTIRADVDTVPVLVLGVLSDHISLVSLEATADNPALKLGSKFTPMDGLLVHIELFVGDKVHVTSSAPVAGLFRRKVSFFHMNLSVFEREEGQVTAQTLDLAAHHQGGRCPAGARLYVPGKTGQVIPG